MTKLFDEQVAKLKESHFLVLYWVARAEDIGKPYNVTNCFDDLKYQRITRTKQNAMAVIEALDSLCFLSSREEGNRRHLYITPYGAQALQALVLDKKYNVKSSMFLEGPKS